MFCCCRGHMRLSAGRNNLERVHKRGRFMRPASQRRLLQVHRDKILCVELRGELFFGSSQQVLQQVLRRSGCLSRGCTLSLCVCVCVCACGSIWCSVFAFRIMIMLVAPAKHSSTISRRYV